MIFNYNADFYPTPETVINRMMMDDSPAGLHVLEPSAGSGNIVKWLQRHGAASVAACELDANLRPILQATGCHIMASDFMTVTAEQISHINMIVMNPPFSQGARHILHAYNIAPAGCCIIALCNSTNLRSSYSSDYRELQKLVKNYGYSEDLGQVFETDAERRTRCEVSLIKIWKEGEGSHEFDGYFASYNEDDKDSQREGLMQYNFVRDIVNRYISAVRMFDETIEAANKINRAAQYIDYTVETDANGEPHAVRQTYGPLPISFQAVAVRDTDYSVIGGEINHLTYKRSLQKYYWRIIFKKLNMERFATRELKESINKFVEQRQTIPFTMANIYRVVDMVIKTNGQRMLKAISEAFDTICSLSAENSEAGEHWKTNANYMVNRRFIVDYITEFGMNGRIGIRYSGYNDHAEMIDDVCKALCYMTGGDYDKIGSLNRYVYNHREEIEWGKWFEWGFFRCRGYKKGTMHFEFLDEKTWLLFNQENARSRGWRLGSTSKTTRQRA